MKNIYIFLLIVLFLLAAIPAGGQECDSMAVAWQQAYPVEADSLWGKATHTVTDGNGNVIVCGTLTPPENPDTGDDIVTIKYDGTGALLWMNIYNGPDNETDRPQDLVVDAQGNVYLTGYSYGATNSDMITIKYNADGQEDWHIRYDGPDHWTDSAVSLLLDPNGDLIVGGASWKAGQERNIILFKYSPEGNLIWSSSYDGHDHLSDTLLDLAIDDEGNIYAAGSSVYQATGTDFLTFKLNSDGELQWSETYDYGSSGNEIYHDELDYIIYHDGGVYVVGISRYELDVHSKAIRYTSDGAQVWQLDIYDADNPYTPPLLYKSVKKGPDGSLTLFGEWYPTDSPFVVIKITSTGDIDWETEFMPPELSDLYFAANPTSMSCDELGNIYVTGHPALTTIDPLIRIEIPVIIKISPTGQLIWFVHDDIYSDVSTPSLSIAVTANDLVFVAGYQFHWDQDYQFLVTRMYECADAPNAIETAPLNKAGFLAQNYPNPFNPSTTIRYQLATGEDVAVSLKIYNASGQLVRTLVDCTQASGAYEVQWDATNDRREAVASGIYFYELTVGGSSTEREKRKMVLLR